MGFINSGAFFYPVSYVMTQLTVDLAGDTFTRAHVGVDAIDPFAPVMTVRAVASILSDHPFNDASGARVVTPLDVLTATASKHVMQYAVGRNAPITVADLLIRMGKDDVLDAMVAAFEAEQAIAA